MTFREVNKIVGVNRPFLVTAPFGGDYVGLFTDERLLTICYRDGIVLSSKNIQEILDKQWSEAWHILDWFEDPAEMTTPSSLICSEVNRCGSRECRICVPNFL